MKNKHTTASIASEFSECFAKDRDGILQVDETAYHFVGGAMRAAYEHDHDFGFVRRSVCDMLPDIAAQAELAENGNIGEDSMEDSLDAVANANTEEMNITLFKWLAKDIYRQRPIDEALGEGLVSGDDGIAEIVKFGYRQQQRNIAESIIKAINAERDERNNEEGGDND